MDICGCWQHWKLAVKCPWGELRIHGERLFTTILIDDCPVTIQHLLFREPELHEIDKNQLSSSTISRPKSSNSSFTTRSALATSRLVLREGADLESSDSKPPQLIQSHGSGGCRIWNAVSMDSATEIEDREIQTQSCKMR